MNDAIKNKAIEKAKQSISAYKVSAIGLSKNGNVIATAINRHRFGRHGGGVHAEMELLRKGAGKISTMIICRVGQGGEVRSIDPCSKCRKVLDRKGIKVITVKP
jgi:cytidine deaminase